MDKPKRPMLRGCAADTARMACHQYADDRDEWLRAEVLPVLSDARAMAINFNSGVYERVTALIAQLDTKE